MSLKTIILIILAIVLVVSVAFLSRFYYIDSFDLTNQPRMADSTIYPIYVSFISQTTEGMPAVLLSQLKY